MRLNLALDNIEDPVIRENFQKLMEVFTENPMLTGDWLKFEYAIVNATTSFKIKHNLGYQPKDAIMLNISNGATVTFNYDNFDKTNIEVNASADCTIRFLLGTISDDRGI